MSEVSKEEVSTFKPKEQLRESTQKPFQEFQLHQYPFALPLSAEASGLESRSCLIGEEALTGAGILNGSGKDVGTSERSDSEDWEKRYSSPSECLCSSTSTTFQKQVKR